MVLVACMQLARLTKILQWYCTLPTHAKVYKSFIQASFPQHSSGNSGTSLAGQELGFVLNMLSAPTSRGCREALANAGMEHMHRVQHQKAIERS